MSLRVSVLINQKRLFFSTDCSDLIYNISMRKHTIESLDHIYEISITKDLFIVTTEDPDFRDGRKMASIIKQDRSINNINAYDWDGNHLWNIAEIVGDIKRSFFGGCVTTKELLDSHAGFDRTKIESGHELFACTADSYLYIIDLTDRKLLQKLETR